MNHTGNTFDQMQRYVRVRSDADAAFVEFDFAIGYPELFVELVLPRRAFALFCEHNNVQHMDAAMAQAVDDDMRKWRYGESHEPTGH
ncbi:phenol hydroxylase subunit [Pseudomonas sp. NPDC090202]|uniref:phenol hydroxylase subunit n=1 Tax=unclassified Pseudomonas TaxID=196821 RepID=UPI0037F96BC3